ncbi:MAG: hypothetical protein WAV95_08070 [Azonexus sp.]
MRLISLLDQLFFSAANFLISLVLIRVYSPVEYAGYANGMVFSLALAGAYRMSFAVPASLLNDRLFGLRLRAIPAQHAMLVFPLLVFALLFGLYEFISGGRGLIYTTSFGVVGCLALFLSIDIDRVVSYRFFYGTLRLVFSLAFSCAVILCSAMIYVLRPRFELAMLFLMSLALLKMLIIGLKVGGFRWRYARLVWHRLIKTTVGWNTFGTLSAIGYASAPQWLLGLFSGAHAVAGFSAVRLPLQPLMVVIRSLDVVDKILFAKLASDSGVSGSKKIIKTYLMYLGFSVFFGLCIFNWAAEIITIVVGERYVGFVQVFRLTIVAYIIISTMAPLETVVYKLELFRSYAYAQFVGGVVGLCACIPLIHHFSAEGAVVGSIVGYLVPYTYLLALFYKEVIRK